MNARLGWLREDLRERVKRSTELHRLFRAMIDNAGAAARLLNDSGKQSMAGLAAQIGYLHGCYTANSARSHAEIKAEIAQIEATLSQAKRGRPRKDTLAVTNRPPAVAEAQPVTTGAN